MGNKQSRDKESESVDFSDRNPPVRTMSAKSSPVSFPPAELRSSLSQPMTKMEKIPCLPDNPQKRRQKLSVGESSRPSFGPNVRQTVARKLSHQVKIEDHVTQLRLNDSEKKYINRSWNHLLITQPTFIHDVWSAAIERSPTVKTIFVRYAQNRSNPDESDEKIESPKLEEKSIEEFENRWKIFTKTVHDFFHRLVIENRLDYATMKTDCQNLGLRHRSYSKHGFQPVFFDIFIVCFLERLEESDISRDSASVVDDQPSDAAVDEYWKIMTNSSSVADSESKEEKKRKTNFAWQKFMRIIVDTMRDGYLKTDFQYNSTLNISTMNVETKKESVKDS